MSATPSMPGRTGYAIAAIVLVIGILGSVALVAVFVFGLLGLGDDLERMVAPGTQQFELSETGRYTIYYEYESVVDGRSYSTQESTPNLDVQVVRASNGEPVPVEARSGMTNYSLIDHSGRSIRSFDIDEPGQYEISAEYTDGSQEPQFVLAIGQGVIRGILTSVGAFLGAGLVFCLFTLIAIAIAGITLLRRYRAGQDVVDPASPPA